MKKNVLFLGLFFSVQLQIYCQKIKDFDNNEYNTIMIGNQEWFTENLKVTKLNEGTAISNIIDYTEWISQTEPAYCWYDNNEASYKSVYGALYNWNVVESNKICPIGWHVPSKTDWTELFNYLGGASLAGGKLKETGTTHWNTPNTGADNSSGFNGLPGGRRFESSGEGFMTIGDGGYFWSSSDSYAVRLYRDEDKVSEFDGFPENSGISIRCIKDETISKIDNLQTEDVILYPNPATDKISIILNTNSICVASLYNSIGEKVLYQQLYSDNIIDISQLSKGVYVMIINNGTKLMQKKIIKE